MLDNYTSQEIKLAREIAQTLNDIDSLPFHLQLVKRHKEEFLREKLARAMAVPESQIKKSRAALYVYLITQGLRYGNSGH
jgi:hypothetical protein